MTIHLNGEDVRAVHMPHGHTDGDSVIWFTQSNVVHMGDDFFNGNYPFVDLENGGSVRGLIAIWTRCCSLPDDAKIIPGHGPLSDKAGLRGSASAEDHGRRRRRRESRAGPRTAQGRQGPGSGTPGARGSSRPTSGSRPFTGNGK